MRPVKIKAVGDALVNKFRVVAENFDPDLKLVQVDDYWNLKRSVTQLNQRLPALIWTLGRLEFDANAPALRQEQLWVANFVWKLQEGKANLGYEACELIAQEFTDEHYDQSLTVNVNGLFVESVIPGVCEPTQDFIDLGLGHMQLTVAVDLHSVVTL